MRCNTIAMKLNSVWLWVTSIFLNVKCLHARTNDCMPRDTFMNRGDSNGWRLIGFVFHYYKKISLGDCAEECLRRTNCKSLNYNAFTMHCELNTENSKTMPANMSSDPECYHSLRSTWETDNLLLGFTLPTCPVNHKVSATNNTCLLAECNDPPERQFAKYTSTLRELDSVVKYSCLSQYGSLGDVTGTCKGNGAWESNSFECFRNCTHPPVVNHATIKPLWALETQILSYVCDANYEAAGDTRIYCQVNGSWTEMNFLCLRICENPPLVPNSSPNASRTLDGRTVSYTCHVDYVGFGNTEVLCKPDGTWSNATYLCIRECKNPPTVPTSTPGATKVLHGNSTFYACNMNYVVWPPNTSTEARCESDGRWTLLGNFSCKRECTNPPSLDFGTANKSSALEGSSVTYMCNTGYDYIDVIRSTCNANGNWTAPSSSCLRVCENPQSVQNSSPNATRTVDGRGVAYTCHDNYVGFGKNEILCNPDGSWSKSVYVCIRECVNPPTVLNSTPNKTRVLHGNSTIYKCNMNYVVWPPDVNTEASCESDGTWTFLANFSCKRECKNPPLVPNSTPSETKVLQGNSTVYACNKSYAVWPPDTATKARCESNGEWIFWANFSCKRECTDPPSLTFGRANETSALEGSSVAYMCDNGYTSVAAINSTCTSSGNWTELSSSCLRECTDPPSLTFGRANETSALEGSSVAYMCDNGYNSIAAINSMCTSSGNWTELSSSCLRECTDPPSLTFGRANETSALEGSSVAYMCDNGYNSIAAINSMCTSSGNWTELSSSCLRECTDPPSLTFGRANETSALEGSSVAYMCDNGYNSIAAINSMCTSSGNWTELSSSCLRECTDPPSLTFGRANETSALEGSSVAYMCDNGYNSIAAINSMCTSSGNWTELSSSCLRECTDPPSLTFGRANETSALEGSSVAYMCDNGYNSIAAINSMCTSSGNWTELSSSCLRECTDPPSLTFGRANETSALEGSSVAYMCDNGYNSIAAINSMCTSSGNWTELSSSCLRECTDPPSLTFGRANETSALEGSSVAYMCDNGYNSIAAINSMCTSSGNWTELSSSCLRECTDPPSLTFGRANETSALEGSSVAYMCDNGYNSIAAINSMCTSSGNWTELSSSCLRECTDPPSLTFGKANETSALEGSSVAYMCDNGYNSIAAINSTCTSSGNWTELSSSCLRECTDPPSLTFGRANETSALEGSSVAYMCDNGYNSIAAINSTCTSSGNWTELSSSCLRECTDPPSPLQNATTTATSALAGQAIFYMCNDGLSSVNVTEMVCLEDGNWSEANFLCK